TYAKVKNVNEDVRLQALVDEKKVIVNEAPIRCDHRLDDVEGTACLPNATIFEELARIGKYKSRRKQRKETKVSQDEPPTEKHIPTPSHDQEDASKQGMIAEIDADENLSLINETTQDQGRMNEEDMFGVHDFDDDVVIVDVIACENIAQSTKDAEKEVSTADPVTTAGEVVTTAEDIKAAKPKTRWVVIQEPSEYRTTSSSQTSQLPHVKEKGKGIMVEPEKPLKKKDQITLDEELARKLKAQMKAKMEEEERIAREKDKKYKSRRKQRKKTKVSQDEPPTEEHIPTPSHDQEDASKQGMIAEIDADENLSLINETTQDQGRMNEEDMFGVHDFDDDEVIVDVIACENVAQSTKDAKKEVSTADPVTTAGEVVTTAEDVEVAAAAPTPQISKDNLTLKDQIALDEELARKLKAQMKAKMEEEERITREKDKENIAGKSFDAIKKMFDKVYKRVNNFMDMNTEIVEESLKNSQEEVTEGSYKRAGEELEQKNAKRQRFEKEDDSVELKRCLEIVPKDDDDLTIKATSLSSKSPTIVDYKI
nr:hypothetical protein [Tanacetum cinerariifolium]